MKKRLCLAATVLLVGLVFVFPSSRLCVYGWLRGEPCYRGKPATYWKLELDKWTVSESGLYSSPTGKPNETILSCTICWQRKPTLIDRFMEKLMQTPQPSRPRLEAPLFEEGVEQGDPAAVDVLIALLNDDDPDIQCKSAAALSQIGPEAKRAVPSLFAALARLPHLETSFFVSWALLTIDPYTDVGPRKEVFFFEGPGKVRVVYAPVFP